MSNVSFLARILVVVAIPTATSRAALAQDVGVLPTEYDADTFSATVHPDGSVTLHDGPLGRAELWGFSFDATDWIMRARGEDPYAVEKLRFLDQTRDDRAAMGAEHRRARLAASASLMRNNIANVWATIPDVTQRKQALFELWDECAESGDPHLVIAGAAARAVVVDFASQLRGRDAFTPAELTRLNAHRTSTLAFAPRVAPTERIASRE